MHDDLEERTGEAPGAARGAGSEAETAVEEHVPAEAHGRSERGGRGLTDAAERRLPGLSFPFGGRNRADAKPRAVDEIKVSDEALATIIGLTAHEVPGVVGMAPTSLSEGLRRVLGARQADEGVVVEHPRSPERADVDIHVVVAYGVNIPVVANLIRERVHYAAVKLAGVPLDDVRVHVVGISRG